MSGDKIKELCSKYEEGGKIVKSYPGELEINGIVIKYDKGKIQSVDFSWDPAPVNEPGEMIEFPR